MCATRTASRTDTTQAARYVSDRVLGDLRSIHENFDIGTLGEMNDLAHDVRVGLTHDCLAELRLFLYAPSALQHTRSYVYKRVAVGSFGPSSHSGRIERSPQLVGGSIKYEVTPRDQKTWNWLKDDGRLRISWRSCIGRSLSGMRARADGGYAKSDLGLSRTVYTR